MAVSDLGDSFKLMGRTIVHANIKVVTGLHIGAGRGTLEIGGVDNPVVRDPLTGRPYIPGSSLKGKLRSLLERRYGLPLNQHIGQSRIHICNSAKDYSQCSVCPIFGIPGEQAHAQPTRLLVRDVHLDDHSAELLRDLDLDAPYAEVKWEVAIDRITSAANPRQLERVPAGAVFGPAQLVFTFFQHQDVDRFRHVVEAMQLLEDDYLGGHGSRGSGRIAFEALRIELRKVQNYTEAIPFSEEPVSQLKDLAARMDELLEWLRTKFKD